MAQALFIFTTPPNLIRLVTSQLPSFPFPNEVCACAVTSVNVSHSNGTRGL